MVVAPEGTRKKANHWKTGFYYIATGANVPLVMGFIDYARKEGGFGPMLMPTGDIEADMEKIRAFYQNITGKMPGKCNPCNDLAPGQVSADNKGWQCLCACVSCREANIDVL